MSNELLSFAAIGTSFLGQYGALLFGDRTTLLWRKGLFISMGCSGLAGLGFFGAFDMTVAWVIFSLGITIMLSMYVLHRHLDIPRTILERNDLIKQWCIALLILLVLGFYLFTKQFELVSYWPVSRSELDKRGYERPRIS